jgi:hypothetical protein
MLPPSSLANLTPRATRPPEQIADAYERANDATYSLTADFRDDVLAAIGLGKISPKKAEEILKANRIGKEDIAMIRSGRYKKYEPSDAITLTASTPHFFSESFLSAHYSMAGDRLAYFLEWDRRFPNPSDWPMMVFGLASFGGSEIPPSRFSS